MMSHEIMIQFVCTKYLMPELGPRIGTANLLLRQCHWNRIARSERENVEQLVVVAVLATDKRETTVIPP